MDRFDAAPPTPSPLAGQIDHYGRMARESVWAEYAQRARLRVTKDEVRADHLVTGDTVFLDGDLLVVETAAHNEPFVTLAFEGWSDYGLTLEGGRLVPVLRTVESNDAVTAVTAVTAITALDRAIADQQFADNSLAERRARQTSSWLHVA
jgi:hypothetical protein